MRKFIINNTQILVGKSAINNTELVNMYLETGYTWFHLHDLPSSHLVIEKKSQSFQMMKESLWKYGKVLL